MVSRHDLTTDPELREQLLAVRHGTAFWHRKVEELSDADFDAPTLLPGWTRRDLVAHVGYNARAISRLVLWANTDTEIPMYRSPEERNQEIRLGATMPPRALRNLNHHAAVSLNVEWRDTPANRWNYQVKTAQGRTVPLTDTVWMRTREVWLHAIDLDNGARFSDIPGNVQFRLLQDIVEAWKKRGVDPGYAITIDGHNELKTLCTTKVPPSKQIEIRGSLPALVAWASGRDTTRLIKGTREIPPRWI